MGAMRRHLAAFMTLAAPAMVSGAPEPRPFWKDHDLGLAVLSTGTWTTYGTLRGFEIGSFGDGLERNEFNKLMTMSCYGKAFGLPAYLGLPIHWTAKRMAGEDLHRVAPGDLELYLGKRIARVEGRFGLIVPAGYDRGFEWTLPESEGGPGNPWIGPGNVQVTLGAAANPNLTRYSARWEASGEAKWALALDDGIAKAGSWALFPSAKLSFRPNPIWKPGVEISGHWKSQHWGRSRALRRTFGADADWSAGSVATFFMEHYLRAGLALGLKAGHSLWGYRDASSYNASLYLLYFP